MSLVSPEPGLAITTPRSKGLAIVLFCLGGFALGEVVALFTSAIARGLDGTSLTLSQLAKLSEPPWWFVVSTLIGLWIGWGLTVAFLQSRYRIIDGSRAFRFRLGDLWMILVAPALQLIIGIVYIAFGVHGSNTRHILGTSSGASLVLLCVLTIVVVPAVEEIFFRGALLPGLLGLVSVPTSVLLTGALAIVLDGVLFGLAHGEWVQLPALAVVGMVLAWLYWRSGRLWPNYILHASFNAVGVFATLTIHSIR